MTENLAHVIPLARFVDTTAEERRLTEWWMSTEAEPPPSQDQTER